MNTVRGISIIIITLSFFTACIKDTCNNELGNTFTSVFTDSVIHNTDSSATLFFSFESLAQLPNEYYEAVNPFDSITTATAVEIWSDNEGIQFNLLDTHLPEVFENDTLTFTFAYQDRKNFIECTHPGSSDLYYLALKFVLTKIGEDDLEISDFSWEEIFLAGHL